MNSKIVLVTGGSSGLGKAICEHLILKGYKVYGTSRFPHKYPEVSFPLLELDVTSDDSVSDCINTLFKLEGQLDVLVNNAGIGITGPVEEIPLEQMSKNFDTNLFGPIRLIKRVLPIMRKNNGGHIINITSIGGYMGLPYRGVYSASKNALEIMSEALRMEVKPFGIKVSTLAPGSFATDIQSRRFHAPVQEHSAYKIVYQQQLNLIHSSIKDGGNPKDVSEMILKIIKNPNPDVRYVVGKSSQKISLLLKRLLPSNWFEKQLMRHFNLK